MSNVIIGAMKRYVDIVHEFERVGGALGAPDSVAADILARRQAAWLDVLAAVEAQERELEAARAVVGAAQNLLSGKGSRRALYDAVSAYDARETNR